MPEAVIVGGVRTPFVKAGAAFNQLPAQELGRLAVRELLDRANVDPARVDELICGNVASPTDAANVGRVIALRAGIPREKIAHTVHRNCASGFECVTQAFDRVTSGRAKCVVAVGVDSMSHIPLFYPKKFADKLLWLSSAKSAWKKLKTFASFRLSDLQPQIGIKLGLTDPVTGLMMGDTAEKLAREFGITRDDQDQFALRSHQLAAEAWKGNRLASEVMTAYVDDRDGGVKPIAQDVGFRVDQSLEALAKLKPYFDRRWGSVTIGNSCQVTDGAAALLIAEANTARELGLTPLGRVRDYAYAGCDPARMGLGPVFATSRVLQQTGLKLSDMQLVELNEAFAAQALACVRGFESPSNACAAAGGDLAPLGTLDLDRLNVNGGAIALGHPVGATGTRLILTLLHELRRRNLSRGLATLCIGGGQGGAVVVETA
jgi:acetyl-CoA C-acetyltransferase/acetyl-CoA acyltransferase